MLLKYGFIRKLIVAWGKYGLSVEMKCGINIFDPVSNNDVFDINRIAGLNILPYREVPIN